MADTLVLTLADADTDVGLDGVTVALHNAGTDALIDSGVTAGGGIYAFTTAIEAVDMYLLASLATYEPYTKAGLSTTSGTKGHSMRIQWDEANENVDLQLPMYPIRSKSQVSLQNLVGSGGGVPQLPISGATVVVANAALATIETLTTDTYGCVFLDDGSTVNGGYAKGNVYHATVTVAAGYNLDVVYFTYQLGVCPVLILGAEVTATTYTITAYTLDSAGAVTLVAGTTATFVCVGTLVNETIGANDTYFALGASVTMTFNASGVGEITVPDLTAWKCTSNNFGYPANQLIYINGANAILGNLGIT